jgi:hypothetical protein
MTLALGDRFPLSKSATKETLTPSSIAISRCVNSACSRQSRIL